jgi:magnesium transporter
MTLALLTMLSMCVACMVAGISGTAIPLLLRRLGADPRPPRASS